MNLPAGRWLRRACPGAAALLVVASGPVARPAPEVFEWERGFGLRVPEEPVAQMHLWVYEWNMFEAMRPGQHTHGTYQLPRRMATDGTAVVDSPALHLVLRPVKDGATLELRVTNTTAAHWPELAGIIPCWNPGMVPGTNPSMPLPLNPAFADPWRRNTYFISDGEWVALTSRALHFNARWRPAVDRAAAGGPFAFARKWPPSEVDATAGLMVRESEDGRWVTGIAWEDFLSVQGHNPWSCLHACVRIGALAPGESRTIRGRLYLFRGRKEDCRQRFESEFGGR